VGIEWKKYGGKRGKIDFTKLYGVGGGTKPVFGRAVEK